MRFRSDLTLSSLVRNPRRRPVAVYRLSVSKHRASAEAEIAASPERVWELVADITLMPRFSTELQSVEWADGFDQPGLGAEFLGTNRHPAIGEWTTRSRIVAFDPPRLFSWAVGDPQTPAAIWTFDVSRLAAGTRVRYTAEIGPGRSGVTMLIEREPDRAQEIIERRLAQFRDGIQATLAGLRQLAEGTSPR